MTRPDLERVTCFPQQLPTKVAGTALLYRMMLANPPLHIWTTDLNEYDTLATRGWVKEGIIGYVIP